MVSLGEGKRTKTNPLKGCLACPLHPPRRAEKGVLWAGNEAPSPAAPIFRGHFALPLTLGTTFHPSTHPHTHRADGGAPLPRSRPPARGAHLGPRLHLPPRCSLQRCRRSQPGHSLRTQTRTSDTASTSVGRPSSAVSRNRRGPAARSVSISCCSDRSMCSRSSVSPSRPPWAHRVLVRKLHTTGSLIVASLPRETRRQATRQPLAFRNRN